MNVCKLNTERLNVPYSQRCTIVCLDNDLCRLPTENNIVITRTVFAGTLPLLFSHPRTHGIRRISSEYTREITSLGTRYRAGLHHEYNIIYILANLTRRV